ncbi:MAG: caspase family protein, partial [Planctomycetota bacterium]
MAILHHLWTSRRWAGCHLLGTGCHLLATCLLLVVPGVGQEPVQPPPAASQWYALLVGCDEYPALKQRFPARYESELRLLGPANDVALMREVLSGSLRVPQDHITTLVGGWDPVDKSLQPTRKNIKAKLRELVKAVSPGDRVVLYFSGHGSQQRDSGREDDPEPDGLDEVFLPADVGSKASAQGRIPGALSDDELGAAARKLQAAGAQVWLIFDCCHAATMVRGGARSRGLDPALFGVDVDAGKRGAIGMEATLLTGQELGNIVAMYASRSDARAPEMILPLGSESGKPHGLFTWTLVQQLRLRGEAWTFRDLQGAILESYASNGGVAESMPVAEGGLNLSIETGLVGTTAERWYLVVDKLGTPRGFPLILLGPGGEALAEGAGRAGVLAALEPFGERLELVSEGAGVTTVTLDDSGLSLHPGGAGEWDLLDLAPSDLTQRLGGVDLLRVAQNGVADGWAEPLDGVQLRIERKRGGRGKYESLAPGEVLHPGDMVKVWLIKAQGEIFDINVLHVDAEFRVNSLYPLQ